MFFDYPALQKLAADGLDSRADGAFEVWVWGKGAELAITFGEQKLEAKASKDRFAWYHPGRVKLQKGQKVVVSFPTKEDASDLMDVPGYLVLSTDPNFDPKRMPVGGLRTLYDASGFKPFESKDEWLKRRESLRRQVLISAGMWPMPPKGDLKPQVYGKEVRDGYTIEKVVLETFPGFYLSGNLFRPAPWVPIQEEPQDVKDRKAAWEKNRTAEKKPAVLCPHGHWRYGRFEPEVQKRCKQLARMGAVVFAYDMVGYADSKDFGHKFLDPQIDLMGFSLFGLQTWDSIRALDFVASLPDVDPERIACTGASGGGTQTFVLTAIDDRVAVAAPTVMVSQDMQGGCACENASGFRIGTDNSEIAAMFAPKPQIMVCCTGDWTKEFPTKGFPEVKATYALLGAADRVETDIFEFQHNYNQTTRERVYAFFSKHLFAIDPALSKELPLEAESSETISTWDAEHPRPAAAVTADGLKKFLAGVVAEQALQFRPTTKDAWSSTREELAGALAQRLAINVRAGSPPVVKVEQSDTVAHLRFGAGPTPRVRGEMFLPPKDQWKADTLVVHPDGVAGLVGEDGSPNDLVKQLVAKGHAVLVIDPYLAGENRNPFAESAPAAISHFTCYNRSTAAERVQDITDSLALLRDHSEKRPVNLVGIGSAGALCLLARTQTPFVAKTAIDANQFDYRADSDLPADQVLPGIVRLGGLRAVGCLAAPGQLLLHNTGDAFDTSWIEEAYRLEGAGQKLSVARAAASDAQLVASLTE
jgi:dienelactone hydrolase